ncbi:MAG: septum site-determining protein MinC [Firmicutes bacterium]|nr:septum site-determining protein MinC [Bacillota bacterium]
MGRDMVSIKGTKDGLVILFDPNREFEEIKNTLLRKMESARGFFKGAKFSFVQERDKMPDAQKVELENICMRFGLVPHQESRDGYSPGKLYARQKTEEIKARPDDGEPALLVNKSLRSGQRVNYPGHVVILGDVHPGAEVNAGGNILITGACRGVVHAGSGGNRSARVIAYRLAPTVVSIAGLRLAPDDPDRIPPDRRMACLVGQEVVFLPCLTGR